LKSKMNLNLSATFRLKVKEWLHHLLNIFLCITFSLMQKIEKNNNS
jgi:hypothetical protein